MWSSAGALRSVPDRSSAAGGKIRICVYAPAAYPLFAGRSSSFGGAEINLFLLARALSRRRRYDVRCLVDDHGQPGVEVVDGVTLIALKSSRAKGPAGVLLKRWRYLSLLLRDDADIYLASSAGEFLIYLALISGLVRRKKILFRVAHEHDLREGGPAEFAASKFLRWCRMSPLGLIYRWARNRLQAVVVQSEDQRSLLSSRLRSRSVVIRNGFPLGPSEFHPAKKNTILWVGRAIRFKRPGLFLELAEAIPDERFLMILQGEGEYADRIRLQARAIPNLRLVAAVPFEEVGRYFAGAKGLVNTSVSEGFPNTFIQAGLHECFLLSFRVNPEAMIDRHQLGWVCDDRLARAVEILKNSRPEEQKRRGENGLAYVRKYHDLEDCVRRYEALFRRILGPAGG